MFRGVFVFGPFKIEIPEMEDQGVSMGQRSSDLTKRMIYLARRTRLIPCMEDLFSFDQAMLIAGRFLLSIFDRFLLSCIEWECIAHC